MIGRKNFRGSGAEWAHHLAADVWTVTATAARHGTARPEARSWYNSLKLSGQSSLYEASDWATAVAAASAYDIFLRTYNASVLGTFVRLSERLGATVVDRARARIELEQPEPIDADEDAADNVVHNWQERLAARHKADD